MNFPESTSHTQRDLHPYDSQTGLPHFDSFRSSLNRLIETQPPENEVAMIWVDLLNLRRQFLLRGWTGTDSQVRRIADVLRSAVDESALLCRFSARCFALALPFTQPKKQIDRRIQAVVDALKSAFRRKSDVETQIAIGVAFYPSVAGNAEDLVRFAGLAASRAADVHSANAIYFSTAMKSMFLRDFELEREMQSGLSRGQFHVAYQPKVDLIDGSVLGAEALIRWNHPSLGAVAPGEFIPIAERSGLIHRIFALTLRNAVRDARLWCSRGFPVPLVAVNASAENLRREGFVETVRRVLHDLPAESHLELEVTESVLFADEELFALRVRQLKEIDVRIAIDDFGTRYTGFNVLMNAPIDAMKIDKCFVSRIDTSREIQAVCQTIVTMARHLRMRTIAEGIESYSELDTLRMMGCEAGQGYLFQRPVAAREFLKFLEEWPERKREFRFLDPRMVYEIAPLQGIA
jgi:EAL domain-containing protein (putative c-di-GMP-specific phosphodiesterase class I)/GGDEF domain-containing protein